jgi:hypothetical protein
MTKQEKALEELRLALINITIDIAEYEHFSRALPDTTSGDMERMQTWVRRLYAVADGMAVALRETVDPAVAPRKRKAGQRSEAEATVYTIGETE